MFRASLPWALSRDELVIPCVSCFPMCAWQDAAGRDQLDQPERCQAAALAKAHVILEPGREDSTGCSPENALKQPEFPQLESAEVLGQLLQHAQHFSRQPLQPHAPAKHRMSPLPKYVHQQQAGLHPAQMQAQRPAPVQQHRQQTQALSPVALMQSPTAALQVWQPLSPGHGPNGQSPLPLIQVAACARPINRPCGPLAAAASPQAHLRMSHAKSMHETQAPLHATLRAGWPLMS